jgi:hypothetical protein
VGSGSLLFKDGSELRGWIDYSHARVGDARTSPRIMSPTFMNKGPEGERDVDVGWAPRPLPLQHAQ